MSLWKKRIMISGSRRYLSIIDMKLSPKKSLGQHFLRSKSVLQKIIDAGEIESTDTILEVGPGEGILTEKLLGEAKKVIAIEKDKRSVELLKKKFEKYIEAGRLILVEEDILKAELPKSRYKVVANIPYYISGALIRLFLENEFQPESMTLLLQKEVVERILAKDKKESLLSISVKAYGTPAMKGIVKAGSFFPPPKVDSAILSVQSISKDFFEKDHMEEKIFFDILHAGFAHKRKFASKNLKEKNFIFPIDLNSKSRAEDLELKEWKDIVLFNR